MKSCVSVMNLIATVIKKFITEGVNSCQNKDRFFGCRNSMPRDLDLEMSARKRDKKCIPIIHSRGWWSCTFRIRRSPPAYEYPNRFGFKKTVECIESEMTSVRFQKKTASIKFQKHFGQKTLVIRILPGSHILQDTVAHAPTDTQTCHTQTCDTQTCATQTCARHAPDMRTPKHLPGSTCNHSKDTPLSPTI